MKKTVCDLCDNNIKHLPYHIMIPIKVYVNVDRIDRSVNTYDICEECHEKIYQALDNIWPNLFYDKHMKEKEKNGETIDEDN